MRKKLMGGASWTAGLVAALHVMGGAASASTLNYGYGYAAASTVGIAADDFAAAVAERSDGSVTVRNFPLSLVSISEAGPALRDGLADIGYVVTAFAPRDYPSYMLMQDIQLMVNLREARGRESVAYAGAVTEYTIKNCPSCLAEFAAMNQVYMGGATSSINMALCNTPVETLEDLQGIRVRVSHAVVSRMFTELGAIPVSLSAAESYEALSQGVIQCTQLSLPELTNMSLTDVVTAVTVDVPGGLSSNVAVGNINADSWAALDDDQREALLWGGSQLAADITWGYYADAIDNIAVAEEHDIPLLNGAPEVMERMRAFAEADLPETIEGYRTDFGVEAAHEIVEGFTETYLEWLDLVENVESRDDLRTLYWERIFQDVDPSTYGL
ncbi:MAG TPA: C4-dicarboxylate ABC transporter substrate-binding protein [Paracoccus sp.]|nr:C4-dicarboxylate ABC transporter substrate-binding protein [Paracoccus sp. (in: a-proteobacteria)]